MRDREEEEEDEEDEEDRGYLGGNIKALFPLLLLLQVLGFIKGRSCSPHRGGNTKEGAL